MSEPMNAPITEQHRRGNRKIALTLALFAAAVFLSYIARQWQAGS